jgi:hypothetical protein
MVPRVAATVETVRPLFESAWPTSAALWLRNGGPKPGGLYANPVLADTYERVVREAEAAGGAASGGSTRRGTLGTAASWPRRSTASAGPRRRSTPPAAATRAC